LLGSNERIEGDLEIKLVVRRTKTGDLDGEQFERRTFIIDRDGDKQEFVEASVDIYGLIDVPIRELTGDGIVIYDDPKQNFSPGGFSYQGNVLEGYIAWVAPNELGEYDAFLFSAEEDGQANVYYASKGASDITQMIQEIEEYDPIDDSFLQTVTIDREVKHNGYVITHEGERIEGEVELSFPPKLWYATDVILTRSDGTVTEYTNDGSLKNIVVMIDGMEKEFTTYLNQYPEVLHRDGSLVHFRNPRPTTPNVAGEIINMFVQGAAGAAGQEIDKKIAEEGMKQIAAGKWNADQVEAFNTYQELDKTDWTSFEFITIYAPEHIVLDEESGRYAMYIPGKSYFQIEGELMGCIDFFNLDKTTQKGLRRMRNPEQTLKFLNTCMAK